jgi:hypothetical protein
VRGKLWDIRGSAGKIMGHKGKCGENYRREKLIFLVNYCRSDKYGRAWGIGHRA